VAGTADSTSIGATATAGPPKTATRVRGDAQRGFAGGVLADSVIVLVKDEYDNPVPGAEVAFVVTGGGGSATPSSQATRSNGQAGSAWRLGTSVGANALEARVAGLPVIPFAATATSGPPASIASVSGDNQSAQVATALPAAIVLRVRDAFGNPVQSVPLESSVGSGSITPASLVTDTTGVASFRWTLGTRAGTQSVTARAGSAVGTVNAVAQAGPAQTLAKNDGDGQTATIGRSVTVAPSVVVTDAYGNGVSGVAVTFAVAGGGGSITGAAPATDASGVARVGSWTLGSSVGTNTLTASVNGLTTVQFTAEAIVADVTYGVEVVWVGAAPSAAAQAAVSAAVSKWQSTIAGDLSNISLTVAAGACGVSHPAYTNRPVDDLLVVAEVAHIDGRNNILAQAGPCLVRSSNGTAVMGFVQVDADDVPFLDQQALNAVVTHEIGHVIGIGTLDRWYSTLTGTSGDPYFPGAAARSHYASAGGALPHAVPVEAGGGGGTALAHWRESDMGRELMTGYLNSGANPLSAITIGALADMGYAVNYGAAESYTVAPGAPAVSESETLDMTGDVRRVPIGTIDSEPPAGR
jgi:hypothetical protein